MLNRRLFRARLEVLLVTDLSVEECATSAAHHEQCKADFE
jgi:hypothetical protein